MTLDLSNVQSEQKASFFDQFMDEFMKYPFGSMPKRDLECLIFSLFEKNGFVKGSNIREKSYKLGINYTRYNSYLTDSNVKFGQERNVEKSVKEILNKLKDKNDVTYEDGVFIFSEENPVIRDDFIQAMKDSGFYTDTSFNKEIVKVKAVALLEFITNSKNVPELTDLINNASFNNKKVENYLLSQKTWKDIGKDLLTILKNSDGDALKLISCAANYGIRQIEANISK